MDNTKVAQLRRADFWTSLALLALAGLMLKGASTFPITDSFGGVQNVWYVSPALFPLIVAGALATLALVLLGNAIGTGGAAAALAGLANPAWRIDAHGRKLVLMALLLIGYVYGLIPSIDYVVGTVFFLLAFITAFYVEDLAAVRLATGLFLAVSLTIAVAGALGLMPAPRSTGAAVADVLVIGALLFACVAVGLRLVADRRRFVTVLATAFGAPLILAPAFKYALLVPLPREGIVVHAMDALRYALRAALG